MELSSKMEHTEERMQEEAIDYGRKWYVMVAVAMGIFLATIDGSIVNVALPTLVRELNTDFPTVQWVVLAYLLTLATVMLSMGRLGDMLGKKPVYTAGFVLFTAGSVLCGLAPTVYWLIGFRVVQAVGASMIMALGMAIVTEAFPPHERGRALGISGTVVSIGVVVGPTVGGLILGAASWHWIFFVNLPVGVVGTLLVLRFVPDFRPAGGQRFDFAGALTLLISLLSLLLAMTLGQRLGFADPRVLLLFGVWAAFLAIFVAIERRSPQPMIDLNLFRNRLFSVNLVTGLITFISMGGTIILMPFLLENVLGYSTRQVGLLMATVPLGIGVVAPISGSLSDRVGTRPITVVGLAAMLLGFFALSTVTTEMTTLGYILRFLPVGIGMGIFQSPNNSAVMGAVPRRRLGVASGLLSMTRTLGQTTGIAVLGALWASRVLFHSPTTLPQGVTNAPPAAQVAGLHDTFVVVMGLLALGLALSIWGLLQERRLRRAAAAESQA
jgi:EmrB/QacA subfamily drug resistance transporter